MFQQQYTSVTSDDAAGFLILSFIFFSLWSGVKLIASQEKSQWDLLSSFSQTKLHLVWSENTGSHRYLWINLGHQDASNCRSPAWLPHLGPRRKYLLRVCLLFRLGSPSLHLTPALNASTDKFCPVELEVWASLLLFLWRLPGICPAMEQARVQSNLDVAFSRLESINKGFQADLEGLSARKSLEQQLE